MSYWLELRCDAKRGDGRQPLGCRTINNEHPGILARNTSAAVASARDSLEAEAWERNWQRVRGFWVCDRCAGRAGLVLPPPDTARAMQAADGLMRVRS